MNDYFPPQVEAALQEYTKQLVKEHADRIRDAMPKSTGKGAASVEAVGTDIQALEHVFWVNRKQQFIERTV